MRKIRKFNGDDDSYVEGTASSLRDDTEDQLRQDQTKRMARMARGESADAPAAPTSRSMAPEKAAEASAGATAAKAPAAKSEGFGSAFAKARAKFLDGGPSTFVWAGDGKRYGTDLKKSSASAPSPNTPSAAPKTDDKKAPVDSKEEAFKKADAEARSPEGQAKRSAMEKSQAIENVYPEQALLGGAGFGIKSIAKAAKDLANRRGVEEFVKRGEPIYREKELEILKDIPRLLGGPKKQLALPAPPKRLGYNQVVAKRKGGSVQGYASGGSVAASSRGDGIAQRGKTRGRMR